MRKLDRQLAAEDRVGGRELEGKHLGVAGRFDQLNRGNFEAAGVEVELFRIGVDLLDRQLGRAFETMGCEIGAQVEVDVADQELVGFGIGMRIRGRGGRAAHACHRQQGDRQ